MDEQKKYLLKGISKLWGSGGENTPYGSQAEILERFGDHVFGEPLDNKTLSSKEYFQYKSGGIHYPAKFIIHDLNQNVLVCVKCKDTSGTLEPCGNCSNKDNLYWIDTSDYYPTAEKYDGLTCRQCQRTHQQNRWLCGKCGCDNSIGNTLFHWVELEIPPKEGCFIATVCYEDYNSNEVIVLRKFRDQILLKSFLGQVFVKTYYLISPSLASILAKSNNLKIILRKYFFNPLVIYIKKNLQ